MLTKQHGFDHLRLVFISANDLRDETGSYISTALEKNMVSAPAPTMDTVLRSYLKKHLSVSPTGKMTAAGLLDPEQCRFRLVASKESGNGNITDSR